MMAVQRNTPPVRQEGPQEATYRLNQDPSKDRHSPLPNHLRRKHPMTDTTSATGPWFTQASRPEHRADGPAKTGDRPTPGRHQTDRTGVTR
jgi:hypothetical protein